MPPARLIVCEKSGRWAVALRRELGAKPRVYETRSLPECWEELAASPASWLLLEVTAANLEGLMVRLESLGRDFPAARAVVCGDRPLASREWLLREAGATHAVFSPRELAPVARLAVRHLAGVSLPPQSLRERVWERLPWSSAYIGKRESNSFNRDPEGERVR